MFNRRLLMSGYAMLLAALIGCGERGPKIVPVEGTVLLDKKPIGKILVEFLPVAEGPRSFAETDSQGHFKLMTDDGKRIGASVGTHKVTLKDGALLGEKFLGRSGEGVDMSEGRKPRISVKLASPDTTPLSITVEAGEKNEFSLIATK